MIALNKISKVYLYAMIAVFTLGLIATTSIASANSQAPTPVFTHNGSVVTSISDMDEGSTVTRGLKLSAAPSSDTTVALTSPTGITLSKTSFTFTPQNWNTPQTFSIASTDDDYDNDKLSLGYYTRNIQASLTSAGGTSTATLAVNITEDEQYRISHTYDQSKIVNARLQLHDDSMSSPISFSLGSKPLAAVTISASSNDTSVVKVTPASVTVSPADWKKKTFDFTVTSVPGNGTRSAKVAYTVTSAGTGWGSYNGYRLIFMSNLFFRVVDTPAPPSPVFTHNGNVVTTVSTFDEGDTTTRGLKLAAAPLKDRTVTLAVQTASPTGITLSKTSFTFTPQNWNTPQTFSIASTDDDYDNDTYYNGYYTRNIQASLTSAGGTSTATLAVNITEDEQYGISHTYDQSKIVNARLQLHDDSMSSPISFSLGSKPLAAVTISASSNDTSVVKVTPASVTVSPADWKKKTFDFTVTSVPGNGTRSAKVAYTVTSAGTGWGSYNGYRLIFMSNLVIRVVDTPAEELRKIVVEAPAATPEEGTVFRYGVKLSHKPDSNVTVKANIQSGYTAMSSRTDSNPLGRYLTTPRELTFTPSNWNTAQGVYIAYDDESQVPSGPRIKHWATDGSDARYAGKQNIFGIVLTNNDSEGYVGWLEKVEASGLNANCSSVSQNSQFGSNRIKFSFGTRPNDSVARILVCLRNADGSYTAVQTDGNLAIGETNVVTQADNWYKRILQANIEGYYKVNLAIGAPDSVDSVNASRVDGSIVVNWASADYATGYNVVYTTNNAQSWNRAATDYDGNTYTITGADDSLPYIVGVQAVNSGGVSAWKNSDVVQAVPAPGSIDSVTASRVNGSIVVNWASADYATGYNVVYTTNNAQSWNRAATNYDGNTYTITGADDSLPYIVGVQAVNSVGFSAWKNSDKVLAAE